MTPAVELVGVSFAYPGGDPVLEDVTLRVSPGERLGILGPNGGGKTTLLNLCLGLIAPTAGTVRVLGRPPSEAARGGDIGAVLQNPEENPALPLRVRDVVTLGATVRRRPWQGPGAEGLARARRALELVGVADLEGALYRELSGGQRQRVRIARAVAGGARVLVLDEPMVGVDPAGQRRFADLMETLHRELGLTVMMVSHDVRAVAAGCDRIACLSRTIHYHAAPEGLTPGVLAEVFEHDVASIFGDVHVHAHPAAECPLDQPGEGCSGEGGGCAHD